MSDTLLAAVIGGLVALTVALLTQFVAEAYKRHRDGNAVAAAIAGELSSYAPAWPLLKVQADAWIDAIRAGRRGELIFRPFERPTDLIIGEMVSKLGLLGVEQIEKIALVYGNIRAFRNVLEVILRDHSGMTDEELVSRCQACIAALDRARREGLPLVLELRARARKPFLWSVPSVIATPNDHI